MCIEWPWFCDKHSDLRKSLSESNQAIGVNIINGSHLADDIDYDLILCAFDFERGMLRGHSLRIVVDCQQAKLTLHVLNDGC